MKQPDPTVLTGPGLSETSGLAGPAVTVAELERQVAQLTIALESNRVIGAATGILMARFGVDRDAARRYLVRLSQDSNIKLRVVAESVVEQVEREARPDSGDGQAAG